MPLSFPASNPAFLSPLPASNIFLHPGRGCHQPHIRSGWLGGCERGVLRRRPSFLFRNRAFAKWPSPPDLFAKKGLPPYPSAGGVRGAAGIQASRLSPPTPPPPNVLRMLHLIAYSTKAAIGGGGLGRNIPERVCSEGRPSETNGTSSPVGRRPNVPLRWGNQQEDVSNGLRGL